MLKTGAGKGGGKGGKGTDEQFLWQMEQAKNRAKSAPAGTARCEPNPCSLLGPETVR